MAQTGADVLIDTIHDWGVDIIFGLPGDGIDGIMEALRKRQDKIRFIQVRHEETAAFAACAYAKYTGKLGVCLATSGPGGLHLINGLYDAKFDSQPVLAITGMQYHDVLGTFTQQDVDLDRVFSDVAAYSQRVMGPDHVQNVAELACRTALSYRTVTHVSVPIDFQTGELDGKWRSKRNKPHHVSEVFAAGAHLPNEHDLNIAASILNQGKNIAILAGQGALDATDELEQIAEKLGAPIIKALLGKAAVPDTSPYTTGGIGLLGTKPSEDAMNNCDTLLIVGSSLPYIEFYPKPGKARAIQIDLNPMKIGLRYPVDVGLVGDSRRTLQELLPLLRTNPNRGFLEKAQDGMREWWSLMQERGTRMDKPMKPQVLAWELGKRLSSSAIISSDSGTNTTWWARQIPAKRGQMYSCSGTLASMAPGLPYTIAAQIAYPERQCVAFVGDGGFSMLMADFVTCVKYKLPVKIIVCKNNVLGQIRWEQMVLTGNPEYGVELAPIDFAEFARACGGVGYRLDDPRECGRVLDDALAAKGPVIVDAYVDPFEPPLPAQITAEQAAQFAKSMAKGERYRGKIISTVTEDKVKEMV